MWRARITSEDLKYSGPHVWPRLDGSLVVDRFIFQRPELAYLGARTLMEKMLAEHGRNGRGRKRLIRVAVRKETPANAGDPSGTRRVGQIIGKFVHAVRSDKTEDVKMLLEELRNYLYRLAPHDPVPGLSITIDFYVARNTGRSASFRSMWL